MSDERGSPNKLPDKCPWKMRIGVFFDGTGNNKHNDAAGNKLSNIAKLSEVYKRGRDNKELVEWERIYKNGVGTVNGGDDEIDGLAKGEEGIERVHEAISGVADFFDSKPCAQEFIVDVFGFSRGAALARHFVNEIHDRAAGPNVKVGFVGIYDTVASFAGSWLGVLGILKDRPGDNINIAEWKVEKGTRTVRRGSREYEVPYYATFVQPYNFHLSSASADYVEHFVARDEFRKNFPLSSIVPNDGGFLNEESFIGAHSDIGGGYGPESKIKNKLEWIARYRSKYPSSRGLAARRRGIATGDYERVERFSEQEVAQIKQKYAALGYQIKEKTIGLKVWLVGEKTVDNQLSKAYLSLMHKRAIESGVPFLSTLVGDDYEIPDGLDALKSYSISLLNGEALNKDNELEIYAKHVHQSDVDEEDRASILNIKDHFADRANEPDDNHVRRVFANDSTLAIVPSANHDPSAKGADINRDNLSSRDVRKLKYGG